MLLQLLDMRQNGYEVMDVVILFASFAVLILVCLPVHELAHAFAAHKLGDNTAKWAGRLTLNPFKHLDVMGTLMMLLCGFGYARPVPVDPYYFKNRKSGMALTALAGPLSNLLMAVVAVGLFRLLMFLPDTSVRIISGYGVSFGGQYGDLLYYAYIFLIGVVANLNIGLAVFNLLPVPPLDGSRIFAMVLPDRWIYTMERYQQYVSLVLMALIFSGILDRPLYFLRHGFGAVICTLFGMNNVF